MKPETTIQCSTLGTIAKQYEIDVRSLWELINANAELKAEVERYTGNAKKKGQKILPPALVSNIYTILGNP